jgi:hypothetical protein
VELAWLAWWVESFACVAVVCAWKERSGSRTRKNVFR